MLENLKKIKWKTLKHAYGPASDVPDLIKELADPDKGVRDYARYELYGNIFHQGSRYQATPFAVPFLYELVASDTTCDRHEIIYLLISLALGYEEQYLPAGIDITAFRQDLAESELKMSQQERDYRKESGYGARVILDCYDAVRNGMPIFISLLTDQNSVVRRAASYGLAWFPENAVESLVVLQRLLHTESETNDIANTVLSIGLLSRSSGVSFETDPVRELLSHNELLIRTSAAIALVNKTSDDRIMEVLIEAISSTGKLNNLGQEIRFNEGRISGYAGLVVTRYCPRARAKVFVALCEALKSPRDYPSLDLTASILDLVLLDRSQSNKELAFDSLELDALQAIADGWKAGNAVFINYPNLMRSYGLPDSKEGLLEFIHSRRA